MFCYRLCEITTQGAERVTRVRSGPLPNPVQLKSATANGSKYVLLISFIFKTILFLPVL
jgi:hypothetical protein